MNDSNKSMLIIETPCSCVTCPLSFYSEHWKEHQCRGREYYRTIDNYEWQKKQRGKDNRPEWCPLVPLPEKELLWFDDETDDYLRGHNDCIDEILGGKNGINVWFF